MFIYDCDIRVTVPVILHVGTKEKKPFTRRESSRYFLSNGGTGAAGEGEYLLEFPYRGIKTLPFHYPERAYRSLTRDNNRAFPHHQVSPSSNRQAMSPELTGDELISGAGDIVPIRDNSPPAPPGEEALE